MTAHGTNAHGMNAIVQSSLVTSLRRYQRSWGLWLLLLVAPVGARWMIPHGDGSGVAIAIGGRLPTMTAAFLGVSLGIVVTTLLLPIAWMYLRSNTTRRQPWQVEEVTAASRIAIIVGRFGADAAVLAGVLAALTLAGWILGWLILPGFDPVRIALPLWLVAAPALLGIAAVRLAFDALPPFRGGFGDFGFFILWMAMLIAPIASQGQPASLQANMYDFAGFIRPLQFGAPPGTNDFAIGGVDVLDLVEEHGTPLFVYDEAHLRRRCQEAVAAFGQPRHHRHGQRRMGFLNALQQGANAVFEHGHDVGRRVAMRGDADPEAGGHR
jgi:hypothetical protein